MVPLRSLSMVLMLASVTSCGSVRENSDAAPADAPPGAPDAPPPDAMVIPCSDDVECESLNDCGAFGECMFADSDVCGEMGLQTRTCTDHACVMGTCQGTDREETQSCTRDTEGVSCGDEVCTENECAFPDPVCGEIGTFDVICVPRVCSAGACVDGEPAVTTMVCTRDTDGTMCAPDECTDGPCAFDGDVCDETGTATRTCTPRTCQAGACGSGTPFSMPVDCARDTDGVVCGMTACSDGPCMFEGHATCDESGTFVRTCNTPACAGATCSGTSTATMTMTCARETGGTTCAPTSCTDTTMCAFEGHAICDETGTKTQSCTPFTCGGDTCNAGTAFSQTVGCTRVTDGDLCGASTVGCPSGTFKDLCCNTSGGCSVTCSPCL